MVLRERMWRMGVKRLGAGLWDQVGKGRRVAKILSDKGITKNTKTRYCKKGKFDFHCQVTCWSTSK